MKIEEFIESNLNEITWDSIKNFASKTGDLASQMHDGSEPDKPTKEEEIEGRKLLNKRIEQSKKLVDKAIKTSDEVKEDVIKSAKKYEAKKIAEKTAAAKDIANLTQAGKSSLAQQSKVLDAKDIANLKQAGKSSLAQQSKVLDSKDIANLKQAGKSSLAQQSNVPKTTLAYYKAKAKELGSIGLDKAKVGFDKAKFGLDKAKELGSAGLNKAKANPETAAGIAAGIGGLYLAKKLYDRRKAKKEAEKE